MVKPFRLVGDQAHVPLLAEVFNFSILCRDLTGTFCTKWKEREST